MSEHRPLSMTLDFRGDAPRIVIDGTDYAMNIVSDGVSAAPVTPDVLRDSGRAKVTVTFIVDDLRILSHDAPRAEVHIDKVTTPDSLRLPLSRGGFTGPVA